ncbi:DUF3283 family protein [Veronia pacifica]|uniref:Pyridoxamine 5-phosphate oxidase n=1 Tax=Veronia pacifica TaxID=1080227 RepID=A0A1C3EG91_9GAMM|nr:DUF3283 family protein [Veronia pacifica]ODA32248.1 pyridoxamine 5-phosphate oxidase [Veronia pacifica]
MNHNLALLPSEQKQLVEIDKQAAYAVWQVKNGVADNTIFSQELKALRGISQQEHYQNCVARYQQKMGM